VSVPVNGGIAGVDTIGAGVWAGVEVGPGIWLDAETAEGILEGMRDGNEGIGIWEGEVLP
jgi:hypothetical protein